ncbi:MAG: hypothetical protein ACJ8CR_14635 [Roseiflexaceae bacterium]
MITIFWGSDPEPDQFELLVDYGSQRIHDLCAERGLDWDTLSEEDRHQLIDTLLHLYPRRPQVI